MATVFISYKSEDRPLAAALAPLLEAKGHKLRYDNEVFIGAEWRKHFLEALLASDVMLVLWTENTYKSQFVPAEVGVVRATPRIGLLPVVFQTAVPPFLHDLHAERVADTKPATLRALAEKIHTAVRRHIEHRDRRKPDRPKVFVSHRHKDEKLVAALVECLTVYFNIDRADIRCTSVSPYRLPVGENTSERLRDEIADAEVVLGILTTDTLASSYVAFELGAAWGRRVWTCPLLARGADQSHIPDPIRDLSPLFLDKERDCEQLLSDMEGFTSLTRRRKVDAAELAARLGALASAAAAPAAKSKRPEADAKPLPSPRRTDNQR